LFFPNLHFKIYSQEMGVVLSALGDR